MICRNGREPDARHAVDGGAQLIVADARELTLDDDVAHGEQAAGVHAPQVYAQDIARGLELNV